MVVLNKNYRRDRLVKVKANLTTYGVAPKILSVAVAAPESNHSKA